MRCGKSEIEAKHWKVQYSNSQPVIDECGRWGKLWTVRVARVLDKNCRQMTFEFAPPASTVDLASGLYKLANRRKSLLKVLAMRPAYALNLTDLRRISI